MKKTKQILAITGAILLVALYVSTLIFAILGSKDTMNWFKASVYATVVVPVLIWAYSMVYKLLKNHYSLHDKDNGLQAADKNDDAANSK